MFRFLIVGLVAIGLIGYGYSFDFWQQRLGTSSLTFNVQNGARDLAPGTPLGVTVSGPETTLGAISLQRADLDEYGNWGAAHSVPVRLSLASVDSASGVEVGRIVGADGVEPVVPDSRYTLTVDATFRQIAFPIPWPREEQARRTVQFSTALSPRPDLPHKPITLRYGEQVDLKWSEPMASVKAVASPNAPVIVRVDPQTPTLGKLALPVTEEGREYLVTIESGVAANGVALQRPYTLRIVAPILPHPEIPTEPVVLTPWQRRVTIRWNTPLADVQGTIGPEVSARWWVDPNDRTSTNLDLLDYVQGQTYYATIVSAQALNGAPLRQPATFEIRTPSPVQVVSSSPEPTDETLPVDTSPSFTFSEPIANHEAAEAAVTIDPPTAGHFEWPDPSTVKFVPLRPFPFGITVTMSVKGGTGTVMAAAGGYYDGQSSVSFTTPTAKKIEVSIGEQKLRLWEGDQMVKSYVIATGVRGAETPVGEFNVEYKMERARFRGRNPSGHTYDLPDVKWVLAFEGDYTIHGSYWRTVYGRPASNGCVSMTDANAYEVFMWAPEGTPIVIHD